MKKVILLVVGFFFSLTVYSQTMYEKYNSYLSRYEYFDTYGNIIGYKTYDRYNDRWVYYKKQQVDNDMHLMETAREVGSMQAKLQVRYDYNLTRLTNSIEALYNNVKTSTYSAYIKKSTYDEFAKCIKILDGKKLNMTDTSQITQAITWLNKSMDNIVNFYVDKENKSKN